MGANINIRPTREVKVGNVTIGGNNPIRIQSMTNTPTADTAASVAQIKRIVNAGAEIVRLTVRNTREAENLCNIKRQLREAGYSVPVVADVHFNPLIAETAAAIVDKVRINPGNYGIPAGKGRVALTEEEYNDELGKAGEAFYRLLDICRRHDTALRIGVNHGSLSPRIINRYGNTPEGMVQSAMEFLQFCGDKEFHNVVVSLKSSNTKIMVQANRLMSMQMQNAGVCYPLHLGVTEAGEGEDGRIRSVAGIGTLLWEGIGDTIRVSLTEDPEHEIPVARKLVEHISRSANGQTPDLPEPGSFTEAGFGRRKTFRAGIIGEEQVPVVVGGKNQAPAHAGLPVADLLYENSTLSQSVSDPHLQDRGELFPLLNKADYLTEPVTGPGLIFLQITLAELTPDLLEKAYADKRLVFVAHSPDSCTPGEMREFIKKLDSRGLSNPVIFKKEYSIKDEEDFGIAAAADLSPLFLDGLGDGVWISNPELVGQINLESIAFSILQSTRARISKTEFISCPSCGRTMFDIQKATAAVKQRTSHLKGLTIAVMGCIVNGPGEMADADYGYVGSGRGRVTLYKKQQVVKPNIPEEEAIEELISLIRKSGDWKEP